MKPIFGVLKISECGVRISEFEFATCLIFQSAICNLKSAIHFAPLLQQFFNSLPTCFGDIGAGYLTYFISAGGAKGTAFFKRISVDQSE